MVQYVESLGEDNERAAKIINLADFRPPKRRSPGRGEGTTDHSPAFFFGWSMT